MSSFEGIMRYEPVMSFLWRLKTRFKSRSNAKFRLFWTGAYDLRNVRAWFFENSIILLLTKVVQVQQLHYYCWLQYDQYITNIIPDIKDYCNTTTQVEYRVQSFKPFAIKYLIEEFFKVILKSKSGIKASQWDFL